MNYQDLIEMIRPTAKLHCHVVKETVKLLESFSQDGWYDEELIQDHAARESALWEALTTLYGRLPMAATE